MKYKILFVIIIISMCNISIIAHSTYETVITNTYAYTDIQIYYEMISLIKMSRKSSKYMYRIEEYREKQRDKGKLIDLEKGERVEVLGYLRDGKDPKHIAVIKILNKVYYIPALYINVIPDSFRKAIREHEEKDYSNR